jgi:predicted ATPase/DNA-binding winged helix-turn-helix (wHTH) protein
MSIRAQKMTEGGTETGPVISFGPFRVDRRRRLIERNGEAIPLGSRAFDILACLLDRAGQTVGKAELLERVWPNNIVVESSLRFHIATLRKVLGEGRYIANIAGQGYCFVAPVSSDAGEALPISRSPSARPLPAHPGRLIGRDAVLKILAEQLLEHRFVTVVGPGGVGKTSVALCLTHDLAAHFDGDTCFFDVGAASNPALLAGGLASALGIPIQPAGATPGLTTFLRDRRMLIVLDGCEANVDSAAILAEQIFRDTRQVHLLATSREVLRAEGERAHRLSPLDYPAPGAGQSAQDAQRFAAVELFIERAASSLDGFALTDEEAPLVSAVCRKLDGLALAIELAAGRIGTYGVREVARQLESQFALLWPGRRTAVARHQTLSATLSWSYQLLAAREQIVFQRLSVFTGRFTLPMAIAAVVDQSISRTEATRVLGSLVSKSLVQFQRKHVHTAYRLLDMTRSYAYDKLKEAGELGFMADRHAKLILRLLEDGRSGGEDVTHFTDLLDDVSAAIDWCLSEEGDLETGAALAALSAPIWLRAGLLVECRFWLTRVLNAAGAPSLDANRQLAIQAALASAETFTAGFTQDSFDSWQSAFRLAESLGNIEQQLTCLIVLWAHKIRSPQYQNALSLALQVEALAVSLPEQGVRAMADWMVGISRHHLGELETARSTLIRSLAADTLQARQVMMTQFGYDRRIPSLGVLSNLHWVAGRPDQALQVGNAAASEARQSPYPVPLCEALTWQALNMHFRGDERDKIDAMLEEVIDHARRHFIESYVGLGLALKGLNAAALDPDLVTNGLALLSKSNYEVFHPLFLTECSRLQAQRGIRLKDEELQALTHVEINCPEHWNSAEVQRNLGEIFLSRGEERRAAQLFSDAAECAERHGARGWALRIALSRARSASSERSRNLARTELQGMLETFTEGGNTADLVAASLFLKGG